MENDLNVNSCFQTKRTALQRAETSDPFAIVSLLTYKFYVHNFIANIRKLPVYNSLLMHMVNFGKFNCFFILVPQFSVRGLMVKNLPFQLTDDIMSRRNAISPL